MAARPAMRTRAKTRIKKGVRTAAWPGREVRAQAKLRVYWILDASGEPTAVFRRVGRAVSEAPAVEVHLHVASLERAADQLVRERILDVALDRPAERPGSIRAVLAGLFDDPVD